MSIIAAAWRSPAHYAIGADSWWSHDSDPTIPGVVVPKVQPVFDTGWYIGVAGAMPGVQRLLRAFIDRQKREEGIIDGLRGAWDDIIDKCGTAPPSSYPSTGAPALLVGPSGIIELGSAGEITWHAGAAGGRGYAAIGCGAPVAMGAMWGAECKTAPQHRVSAGVRAACDLVGACRLPMDLLGGGFTKKRDLATDCF